MAATAAASEYLRGTRDVIQAGDWLREVIGASEAAVDDAVRRLEDAADGQEARSASFRTRGFSSLESARREEAADDLDSLMGSVVADVEVANVLMNAGRALGETGERADPTDLDAALQRLRDWTEALEPAPGRPDRLGFAAAPAPPPPVQSPDDASAAAAFREQATDSFAAFVSGASEVTTLVLKELKDLAPADVAKGLERIGRQWEPLKKTGRLVRRGLKKLEKAVNALIRILGSDALAGIRDRAAQWWQKLTGTKDPGSAVIGWALRVGDAEQEVERVLSDGRVARAALDEATRGVAALPARFARTMGILKKTIAALGAALAVATFLSPFVPGLAVQLPLAAAAAYALVLAAVLLVGLDYVDSGKALGRVEGVCSIARKLAS